MKRERLGGQKVSTSEVMMMMMMMMMKLLNILIAGGQVRLKSALIALMLLRQKEEKDQPNYYQNFGWMDFKDNTPAVRPLLLAIDDEEQHRSMLQSALGPWKCTVLYDTLCTSSAKKRTGTAIVR